MMFETIGKITVTALVFGGAWLACSKGLLDTPIAFVVNWVKGWGKAK